MDVRELRSVAMSIILKQRVCRALPKAPSLYNRQEYHHTYPSSKHNRHLSYQYKDIDVSVFDALFEGKPIEGIEDISNDDFISSPVSETVPSSRFFGECKYRYVKDREFFRNYKKTVSQLILYWETVWLVGRATAVKCAGWDW